MKLSDHIERLEAFKPNLVFINTMTDKEKFNDLSIKEKLKTVLEEIKNREKDLKQLYDISRALVSGKNVNLK